MVFSILICNIFSNRMEKGESGEHFNEWGRKTFDRSTHYIDSTKSVLQHYQSKKIWPGQEKHIHKINGWLEEEGDRPLVFRTEPGCGMKTMLAQWERGVRVSNQSRKEKVLTIMHFASGGSNDSNYFYSLYQIIVRLKEALKLKQSVDLLEENIRKFFAYWLDIVSAEVHKQQIIYCAQQIYNKVVIVIEAVDRFTDQDTSREANIAFWLPEKFPKNVKIIVSARRHSESIQHLERIGCEVIDVRTDPGIAEAIHQDIRLKSTALTEEASGRLLSVLEELMPRISKGNNIYSFLEFYAGVYLPRDAPVEWTESLEKRIPTQPLAAVASVASLYNFTIDWATDNPQLRAKYESGLVFLALAQKGLTVREMLMLTKLSEQEWATFLGIFGCGVVGYEGVFSIKARWLVEAVLERERGRRGEGFAEAVLGWHERMARAVESTENSIRKLEEQAYHLFCGRSYFRLKEMVSNIENFLLLFNPHNKYELSRYWQKLEEKGFDPVIEYNKAVEGFSMHYHPSDENIFRIIVQISSFLKEFCHFETYDTPAFRHPYIEGNMQELRKIGLLTELADLDIYVDNSFNPPDAHAPPELTLAHQIQELKQKYFPKDADKTDLLQGLQKAAQEADLQPNPKRKNESPKILSEIEQLNVDVPMNRNKFRHYYLKNIREFIKKEEEPGQARGEGAYLDVDDPMPPHPAHNHPLNALSFQKIRENYRLREVKPTLYYYKRWIWIQFPWICISLNNNYSTTPELRKKIEGEDTDHLELEYKYTKQSLLVAIQAREKKRQMFTKKDNNLLENSKGFSKTRSNMFSISKFTHPRANPNSKTLPHFDLSLQTLSKQLELRTNGQAGEKGEGEVLSEIKENCEQEMKFITLRREFQSPGGWGEANEVLPRVKWAIKEHTSYELEYMKSHIEEKKKKLNKIIYDNKRLGEVYQELRVKEALTRKNLHEQEEQKSGKKSRQLDDLLRRKEEVITEFCKSLLQKERLKIILKLCSENKTRNEEYLASLNYFLQNLKKMINSEKENMKRITEELESRKALTEKQAALEQERTQNRRVVQQEAQKYLQEKGRLERQIENIQQTIWEDIQDQKDKIQHSLSGHLKHREEKNQIKEQEKTIRQLEDRYDRASNDYAQLRQLFDLSDPDAQPSPKMKALLEQNERNKQLKITYFEKKNRLEELQRELEREREENEKDIQRELKKMAGGKVDKPPKESREPTDRRLQILLDNLCLKLAVKDKQQIVPALQAKMQEKSKAA